MDLGQIGGIVGIIALIGVVLGNRHINRTEELKVVLYGLQMQLLNSHRENGRLFDKIEKLESKLEKLRESFYELE